MSCLPASSAQRFQQLFSNSPFFPQDLRPDLLGWRHSLLTVDRQLDPIIDELIMQPIRMYAREPEFWMWSPAEPRVQSGRIKPVRMPMRWNCEEFFSCISTWTAVEATITKIGWSFLRHGREACEPYWGPDAHRRLVQFGCMAVLR